MLPKELPTDPEELERLYQAYISSDQVVQAELDRLTRARLRVWGYDPEHVTSEQLLVLMEESMNHLLLNLYGAMDSAPDDSIRVQLQEIVAQAEELRGQIGQVLDKDQA
jgi:hypothetical protein